MNIMVEAISFPNRNIAMHAHRFADLLRDEPRQPALMAPHGSPGFMMVPWSGGPQSCQSLYAWAFEQAQAAVRPSLLERAQRVESN
jgi:hypothetical protein